MTAFLGGCEGLIKRPSSESGHDATIRTSTPQPNPEIAWLLDEAATAFHENKLTSPLNDNAYYRYLRVLSLDPGNSEAEQGIADIVEKYLEWAMENASDGHFAAANSFLNKARSVDETHPNIAAAALFVADREQATQLDYPLSPAGLDGKTGTIVRRIQAIATTANDNHAMAIIRARNDEEGRWIYQQLNSATAERIRGRIELAREPSITLVY